MAATKDKPKQGPTYCFRQDGSGYVEWDNLEQLAMMVDVTKIIQWQQEITRQ